MVFSGLIALVAAFCVVVYRWFRRRAGSDSFWWQALAAGVTLGILRAAIVCSGWYVVEWTSGALQIAGYFAVMAALPEAALIPRSVSRLQPNRYVLLAVLTFTGALAWTFALAGMAFLRYRISPPNAPTAPPAPPV